MRVGAGERLRGRTAAKLAVLAQRVSEERRCYLDVAWAGAAADRARYEHMHPHVAALVQVELSLFGPWSSELMGLSKACSSFMF